MHGITHHLGISTHDVGNMNNKFEESMVFTIEPGIYIKNESIGIRLENDVMIKNNKIEDISSNIPIEIEEIEYIMNKFK
jgi:Xaa-Pro aminopeptidase